ncbi:DUF4261 domain-containing protein [Clostridium minihomine]|uniref:DUF4261 domain-containing protein n=1 Tax=Clostridium minihomine TaxID=2045012 RepID=UPI000C78881D|nr:DUF4261 domain-containing protein [Clostridium minihomine]
MIKNGDSFVEKWHSVYFFIPLFESPAKIPPLDIFCDALSKKFGKITPLAENPKMPSEPSDLTGFLLEDHPAYYQKEDQWVPTQLILYGPDEFDQDLWNEQITAQFWNIPDKAEFLSRCNYSIMASNMLAANLPITEGFQIIADYADLILDLFPDCIGIYWPHSQRLVTREAFQNSQWSSKELHFLDGGVNVRFFNIAQTGEMLFDTLGLTPIGLPDLQCHCKDLEPNHVVGFLYNLAAYLYRSGDIIEDGNTVEGIDGEKWLCQREDALATPVRMVLDINAGKYAGGNR